VLVTRHSTEFGGVTAGLVVGPAGSGDKAEVEAAIFKNKGRFIAFYSEVAKDTLGRSLGKGSAVFLVAEDIVASVRQV
jgi:hypothetical protein